MSQRRTEATILVPRTCHGLLGRVMAELYHAPSHRALNDGPPGESLTLFLLARRPQETQPRRCGSRRSFQNATVTLNGQPITDGQFSERAQLRPA